MFQEDKSKTGGTKMDDFGLGDLCFGHWDLFRISRFGFRIPMSRTWQILVCLVLAGLPGLAAAPLNPATGTADAFFGATNLYTFHLTIAPDQWAIMEQFDQLKQNANRPPGNDNGLADLFRRQPRGGNGPGGGPMMNIEFKKGTATLEFDGQPCGSIRVRFKGNSSFNFARNSLKRSLKLDFNDLEPGRTFFGLTKLNLNNNAMDPSQLREALAYEVFRTGGVPACRTAFAKVFLTIPGKYAKAYAGLYTVVEQVDERFLKSRFDAKDGMLLKPEHLPGLPYFGNNWSAYTNRVEAKTTVKTNDSARFIEFARSLNQDDDPRFQAAVGDFVDVDEFLRFIALEALLSNMDSPLMTGHNYYLYLHPKTRKFTWIPWDLNEAFGGFMRAGNASEQMDLSLDHPYTRVNRLAERLLQTDAIKKRYHDITRGLLATNFSSARLFPVVDAMAATIRPALADDRMVSLPQFEAGLSDLLQTGTFGEDNPGGSDPRRGGFGGFRRPRIPLKAFILHRVDSARLQLDGKAEGYIPREMRPGPNGPQMFGPPGGQPQPSEPR